MRASLYRARSASILLSATLGASIAPSAAADTAPAAGMLRCPDVSATHIVFGYANDLWLAPRAGGTAVPLASPAGIEQFPRFSPDGTQIAYMANYDGNSDLYVTPTDGGVPTRVTQHPGGETLCDWTPDGKSLLFYGNGLADMPRQTVLMTVSTSGGIPEKLPVPYGATGSISAEGWLAYTPHTIDNRTWKRYRGGMQTDIWLFHLKDHKSQKITDWEGLDSQPMWHGKTVYYLSDAGPEHRLNIWSFDTTNGQRKQVTTYKDFDAKWPAIGPGADGKGEIVLQNGPDLHLVDLASGATTKVNISIPGDRPLIRPQRVDASKNIEGWDLSATGKRAVMAARGDIWTVPAKNGTPRNHTATAGTNERDPAWSPDGKSLAYFSDATGEYELYVRPADNATEARQLTKGSKTFYRMRGWSPDSKHICYADKSGRLLICTVADGKIADVDRDPAAGTPGMSWSSDSRWLAYTREVDSQHSALFIYDTTTGKKQQITGGMFSDDNPCFDRKGEFLYLTSSRKWSEPQYEDLGTTFAYHDTQVLLAAPLRKDVKLPWAPKSDEEGDDKKDEDKKDEDKKADDKKPEEKKDDAKADEKKDDKKDEKPKPVEIELDGFEQRIVRVPNVEHGRFAGVMVNDAGHLMYSVIESGGGGDDEDDRGGNITIKILDPADEKLKSKNVIAGISGGSLSGDGKKLLVRSGEKFGVIDTKADQKIEDTLPIGDMQQMIDPRQEWAEVLREAWRLQRDFFYDAQMHHVDWDGVYKQYAALLPDCYSREDVTFLIQEMISELNVGHAYYRTPPSENGPRVGVGLLGCDFAWENNAYRVKRIYKGAAWDVDARNPLLANGVDVKEGDYLHAINGVALSATLTPYAAAAGLAGKTASLAVGPNPTCDDKARTVVVKMLDNEIDLRFRNWIESKRAYVDAKSNGQVGYIYVPNTGVDGQNELFRQFYQQRTKAALIIDERWNGGGQIPTRFIELLNRPVTNFWARRDGRDWTWPPDSHQGPQCMLINGLAGSGGDMFPWLFRHNKLGKLIGTRTWGGLVGISGNPNLIDGTNMTVPTFGFYETDGTWGVEGHGVDPDIEVIDDPALMWDGGDPQLDTAIKLMNDEIRQNGYAPPKRPESPDRKGMGIPKSDY
ncbi:MAG: PDZ domain-containing protein [Phycisphaerae bacterium]|nr:PDZ domain-containing protein [Phycisphaerae bacterium]